MPAPVGTPMHMLPCFTPSDLASLRSGTTLLDFTASWCGPCRTMDPVLAALATEYGQRVRFAAIDVDEQPALAHHFDVRSMPTVIVIRDGREVARIVGARPRAYVAGVLDRVLDGEARVTAP
jgi:thioredoxin 1